MVTNSERVAELRLQLRRVMSGLWARRRPTPELLALVQGASLGRRHVAVLAQVGTEGERSVGDLARELGLSLPAASTLARELAEHGLLERREDTADRRRTVVALAPGTEPAVRAWLSQRSRPLERTLAALAPAEQDAFLKGLRTLADALMEESARGPLRSHHRHAHRRRTHRDRPV
jgi:DNA-binding MarR family transcriptional regulator